MPGFWELAVLIIILVIVFGARRLPALGEAIGRAVVSFRGAAKSDDGIEVKRLDKDAAQPGGEPSGDPPPE